jgi:signal transduction histidine kinase
VSADGDLGSLDEAVVFCLYRVAQEALRNVGRHAAARRVDVSLSRDGSEVLLSITDDGRGFDPGVASSGQGLGLRSVDERVRMVSGRVVIDSVPGRGTALRIYVPADGGAATLPDQLQPANFARTR